MILIIRGSHANQFELQNYQPLATMLDISVVTSKNPLTDINLPAIKLWSPTDLPNFPLRRQLLNRLIGGEQWLAGLGRLLTHYHYSNNSSICLHTAETYTPYTHQAVQLRRQGRVGRLICTCWETIPHNNEKFTCLRRWKSEAYQYVDLFHTPTERAKEALVKEGVDSGKIRVIPYGVDLALFHPPRSQNKNKKPVVLTVARPVQEKGYHLWQQLAHEYKDLAEFRWVSGLEYSKMPQVYRQADIFLLPSLSTPTWEEQYGMVLVEAMAMGLPIIATNSGAIPEVVGEAALLVKPTLQSIKDAILQIQAHTSIKSKLSQLALDRVRSHYEIKIHIQTIASLYSK